MKTQVSTLYFYIARTHDGIEWYLMDLEDDKLVWTRFRSRAIKQLTELNLVKFIDKYLPGREGVYIRGISDLIEVTYNEWSY